MSDKPQGWINDLEIENANIKWGWSHFAGQKDTYNDEGDYNFTIVIPDAEVDRIRADGWNVREREGYEEGDPPEYTLEVKISDKFGVPMMFFIKNGRKVEIESLKELKVVKRAATEQIDVVISPSRWENSGRSGISAYVKEMYITIIQSRFGAKYDDYEAV